MSMRSYWAPGAGKNFTTHADQYPNALCKISTLVIGIYCQYDCRSGSLLCCVVQVLAMDFEVAMEAARLEVILRQLMKI